MAYNHSIHVFKAPSFIITFLTVFSLKKNMQEKYIDYIFNYQSLLFVDLIYNLSMYSI